MNRILAFAFVSIATSLIAAGPGGGGNQPGGGGNQPSGNQPGDPGGGASATFTFDTFLAASTATSGLIIREGVITGHESPTSVTAPASIASIAEGAFAGCTTLTSIDLSATSITEIPESAFALCTALTTVTLPASCTSIGANAFYGCTSLSSVTAPGVTKVGADAFHGCASLATLPPSATTLGKYSFAKTALSSVDASGMNLSEGAFSCCTSLTEAKHLPAELPTALFACDTSLNSCDLSGVSTFGAASLAGCDALTALSLDGAAEFGDYAFAAGTATLATVFDSGALPDFTANAIAFLGRGYSVDGESAAVFEAAPLVDWLANEGNSYSQPTSYGTADIEAWLADKSNLGAIVSFCYADNADVKDESDVLTVKQLDGGEPIFTFVPSSSSAINVSVVGTNDLGSDFSEDNLTKADNVNGSCTYTSKDENADACFVRLKFTKAW